MRRLLLAPVALLLAVPAASAHHWTDDVPSTESDYVGDSACHYLASTADCLVLYLCTGGAPPQVVDTALHCAARAAGESGDVAAWAPVFAYGLVDYYATEYAESRPAYLNARTSDAREPVNFVLCNQVWSFFCANPIALPEHAPAGDPVGPYPL